MPAAHYNIDHPFPAPPEAFMALELVPCALTGLRGTVRYPAAFDDA